MAEEKAVEKSEEPKLDIWIKDVDGEKKEMHLNDAPATIEKAKAEGWKRKK